MVARFLDVIFCFSNPRSQNQPQREMEQEYDRDLKQNGGYAYTTDRARGAGGRSSNQRGARGAGGSGAGGRGDGDGIGSLDEDLAKFLGNGEDGGGAEELHKLASEISDLDEWSKDTDPYEFITQPQRFPHEDGADLGDNYIAGLTGLVFRVLL